MIYWNSGLLETLIISKIWGDICISDFLIQKYGHAPSWWIRPCLWT